MHGTRDVPRVQRPGCFAVVVRPTPAGSAAMELCHSSTLELIYERIDAAKEGLASEDCSASHGCVDSRHVVARQCLAAAGAGASLLSSPNALPCAAGAPSPSHSRPPPRHPFWQRRRARPRDPIRPRGHGAPRDHLSCCPFLSHVDFFRIVVVIVKRRGHRRARVGVQRTGHCLGRGRGPEAPRIRVGWFGQSKACGLHFYGE